MPQSLSSANPVTQYSRRHANFDLVRENIAAAGGYTFRVLPP